MEKFYSKVDPNILLHCIKRYIDIKPGRENLIDSNEYIQCAALNLEKGTTFLPHKHISKKVSNSFPQESWVVIKGSVKCIFYDLDDTILAEPILYPGDASFSLYGGHNYETSEDYIGYEFKVGPYFGVELDKKFI